MQKIDERRATMSAADFIQMEHSLTDRQNQLKNNFNANNLEKERLNKNRAELVKNVNDYIHKLANSDLSGLSLKELQDYTNCLETFGLKTTNHTGDLVIFRSDDARNLIQKIEAQQSKIKTQTLDSVKNNPQNLSPADLWKLRENLMLLPSETETTDAAKKLEDVIVAKAQELSENKTVILDMNQAYVMRDMLQAIEASPVSDNKEANAPVIKSAQEVLKDQIDTFEEFYGIGQPLLDETIVKRNLDTLAKMPSNDELFSYNEAESFAVRSPLKGGS